MRGLKIERRIDIAISAMCRGELAVSARPGRPEIPRIHAARRIIVRSRSKAVERAPVIRGELCRASSIGNRDRRCYQQKSKRRMRQHDPHPSALRRRPQHSITPPPCALRRSGYPAAQAEIFAQGFALVVATKQAAPLQFRHHLFDEIVEPAGKIRKHDDEAVAGFGGKPFLHLVGDGRSRADHGQAGITAEPLGELAHGEFFPLRQFRWGVGGRSCWRCSRGYPAKAPG